MSDERRGINGANGECWSSKVLKMRKNATKVRRKVKMVSNFIYKLIKICDFWMRLGFRVLPNWLYFLFW